MFNQEKLSYIIAVALLTIAVQVITVAEYFGVPNRKEHSFQNRIVCTEEAKICPDGSAVGRTGPNCEFTECAKTVIAQIEGSPSTSSGQLDVSSWKTYRNEEYGFEFKYPNDWKILIDEYDYQSLFIKIGYEGYQQDVISLYAEPGLLKSAIGDAWAPRKVLLNGIDAVAVQKSGPESGYQSDYEIYFEHKGFVFHFGEAFGGRPGDGVRIEALHGSFKFIP